MFELNGDVECPYCGHEQCVFIAWSNVMDGEESQSEVLCWECDKKFLAKAVLYIDTEFWADKIKKPRTRTPVRGKR